MKIHAVKKKGKTQSNPKPQNSQQIWFITLLEGYCSILVPLAVLEYFSSQNRDVN